MQRVEIQLDPADFGQQMGAMRLWLNQHRCEASIFDCNQNGTCILVSVVFYSTDEAQAFADRFTGRLSGVQR